MGRLRENTIACTAGRQTIDFTPLSDSIVFSWFCSRSPTRSCFRSFSRVPHRGRRETMRRDGAGGRLPCFRCWQRRSRRPACWWSMSPAIPRATSANFSRHGLCPASSSLPFCSLTALPDFACCNKQGALEEQCGSLNDKRVVLHPAQRQGVTVTLCKTQTITPISAAPTSCRPKAHAESLSAGAESSPPAWRY